MRLTSLSHVIAFIALPLVSHAEPVDECDRLAALEADPSAVSEPVAFIDIQPERVVKACTDALNAGSNAKPRFLLQRARGYLRGGQAELAFNDLNAAHKLGYPAATFGLATAYFLGDDVERDYARAESLFLNAYEGGVYWAARGLASLYGDPASELFDLDKSEMWGLLFSHMRGE